jgi:hypothetical protein
MLRNGTARFADLPAREQEALILNDALEFSPFLVAIARSEGVTAADVYDEIVALLLVGVCAIVGEGESSAIVAGPAWLKVA